MKSKFKRVYSAQHNVNLTYKQCNFWFMIQTHKIQYKDTNGEGESQQPSSREKKENRIKKQRAEKALGASNILFSISYIIPCVEIIYHNL